VGGWVDNPIHIVMLFFESLVRFGLTMKKVYILLVFITTQIINAQENQIFLELGGPGNFGSANYDLLFTNNLTLRLGISYYPGINYKDLENIPSILGANYLLGSKHRLEFGGGWAFGGEEFSSGLYVIAGYRYQKPDGRDTFRFGLTIINEYDKIVSPYLGLGYIINEINIFDFCIYK